MHYKVKPLLLAVVVLVLLSSSIFGCTSKEVDNTSKLDFNVKRLISAYEEGTVEEFAQQNKIELKDNSVTIVLECKTGQDEAVAKEIIKYGATQIIYSRGLVQGVVPITNLTVLADIPSVTLVRLPIYPVENY